MAKRFIEKFSALAAFDGELLQLDAMVARILILHDWRRMLLRYPVVPSDLQPDEWSMPTAHNLIAKTYKSLLGQSEGDTLSTKTQEILDARF